MGGYMCGAPIHYWKVRNGWADGWCACGQRGLLQGVRCHEGDVYQLTVHEDEAHDPTEHVAFFVPGIPIPQGSKKWIPPRDGRGGVLINDNDKVLRPWRKVVAQVAMLSCPGEPFTGPVKVKLRFRLQPPATVNRKYPSVRPDLDKLTRAVFDSMTGQVFKDDAQVVWMACAKVYDDDGNYGVEVEVEAL